MGKFKGITGNKTGRIGNEIYYMNKTVNLIRSVPTHVYDPKSKKQMIQRIKMVNTQNGYKYIQQFNDMDLFPIKRELENQQNVFVRLNVDGALLVPKPLCKKKYAPIFTLDLIMSNGNFASPKMNAAKIFSNYLGVIIDNINPQEEVKTVAQASNKLLSYYPTLENGDKIVFYIYGTKDIESSDDENAFIKYSDRDVLQAYGQRSIFTINTSSSSLLLNEGFFCADNKVLSPMITNNSYNWVNTVENKYVSWMTATFIHKPNTEQQRIGISGFGYTTGYADICNELYENKNVQLKIIEEWGANMNYNVEIK